MLASELRRAGSWAWKTSVCVCVNGLSLEILWFVTITNRRGIPVEVSWEEVTIKTIIMCSAFVCLFRTFVRPTCQRWLISFEIFTLCQGQAVHISDEMPCFVSRSVCPIIDTDSKDLRSLPDDSFGKLIIDEEYGGCARFY